jgi:hypothetical protein
VLWLGLGLGYLFHNRNKVLHRFHSCALYRHLENILAHCSFGSVMYFKEKTNENFENQEKTALELN